MSKRRRRRRRKRKRSKTKKEVKKTHILRRPERRVDGRHDLAYPWKEDTVFVEEGEGRENTVREGEKTTNANDDKRFLSFQKKKKWKNGKIIFTLLRRLSLDARDEPERVRPLLLGRMVSLGKGDVLEPPVDPGRLAGRGDFLFFFLLVGCRGEKKKKKRSERVEEVGKQVERRKKKKKKTKRASHHHHPSVKALGFPSFSVAFMPLRFSSPPRRREATRTSTTPPARERGRERERERRKRRRSAHWQREMLGGEGRVASDARPIKWVPFRAPSLSLPLSLSASLSKNAYLPVILPAIVLLRLRRRSRGRLGPHAPARFKIPLEVRRLHFFFWPGKQKKKWKANTKKRERKLSNFDAKNTRDSSRCLGGDASVALARRRRRRRRCFGLAAS